jgi:hypothetical protein
MEALLSPAAWGSPVGLGIFMALLGVFIYLLSLADKNKRNRK